MRLEPVYLVAPESEEPRHAGVRRRALLLGTGAAFLAGALGGWGLRRALSRRSAPAESSPELAWALRLQAGDETELVRNAVTFTVVVETTWDERLVEGLERLRTAILSGRGFSSAQRRTVASALVDFAEHWPAANSLRTSLEQLRRLR